MTGRSSRMSGNGSGGLQKTAPAREDEKNKTAGRTTRYARRFDVQDQRAGFCRSPSVPSCGV